MQRQPISRAPIVVVVVFGVIATALIFIGMQRSDATYHWVGVILVICAVCMVLWIVMRAAEPIARDRVCCAKVNSDIEEARLANIPTNATAVILNVVAVNPTNHGHLTIYPCDTPRPHASNLNYPPGTTTANLTPRTPRARASAGSISSSTPASVRGSGASRISRQRKRPASRWSGAGEGPSMRSCRPPRARTA